MVLNLKGIYVVDFLFSIRISYLIPLKFKPLSSLMLSNITYLLRVCVLFLSIHLCAQIINIKSLQANHLLKIYLEKHRICWSVKMT